MYMSLLKYTFALYNDLRRQRFAHWNETKTLEPGNHKIHLQTVRNQGLVILVIT